MDKFRLKLDHIGLITSDLTQVADFYENILGFKSEPVIEPEDRPQKMQYFQKDGYVLEFIQPFRELAPQETGMKHIAFTCILLDEAFAEIKAKGYKMLMEEPLRFEDRRFFFFYGVNSTLIEFMEFD